MAYFTSTKKENKSSKVNNNNENIIISNSLLAIFFKSLAKNDKKRKYANKSLEKASNFALYALGIIIRNNKILEHLKEDNQIHIANHDNPIDILIIQAFSK